MTPEVKRRHILASPKGAYMLVYPLSCQLLVVRPLAKSGLICARIQEEKRIYKKIARHRSRAPQCALGSTG